MQVFCVSLLGAYRRLHIYLNCLSTCRWEENIFFLPAIPQKHVLASVLFAAERQYIHLILDQANNVALTQVQANFGLELAWSFSNNAFQLRISTNALALRYERAIR